MKTTRLLPAGWRICLLALLGAALGNAAPPERDPGGIVDVITQDVTRFTHWLESPSPQRRVEGIQGLAYLRFWPSEASVLALSRDESPEVQRAAMMALGRLGTACSVPRLIECLDHPSQEMRRHALMNLRRLTGQDLGSDDATAWRVWWEKAPPDQRVKPLLERVAHPLSCSTSTPRPSRGYVASLPGRRSKRISTPRDQPPADRLHALQAIRHLATPAAEPALIVLRINT